MRFGGRGIKVGLEFSEGAKALNGYIYEKCGGINLWLAV